MASCEELGDWTHASKHFSNKFKQNHVHAQKYAQKVLFSVTGYVISAVNNPKKNIDVYSI